VPAAGTSAGRPPQTPTTGIEMKLNPHLSPDEIRKAIDEVREAHPDYRLLFDMYADIFIAQEESKPSIQLKEFSIPEALLAIKRNEKFPLVEASQFAVDADAFEALFKRISAIFMRAGAEFSETAKALAALIEGGKISVNDLREASIKENSPLTDKLADEPGVNGAVAGHLLYYSAQPSFTMFAQQLSGYLSNEEPWDKGYCPVCGSVPEISLFEENGKRLLMCSFCEHTWESKRIYCPYCENTDHETLRYFTIDDTEEYRVDVCERCRTYIKTIDLRKMSRTVYLPFECVSTPYIDLKFQDMGYSSGQAAPPQHEK
jgi:FdhE protein